MSDHPHPVEVAPAPAPSPSAASAPGAPFPEARYQAAMAALRNPKQSSRGLVLVLSLAAFVLLQENRSPTALLVLLAVIVFHELGHYVGMRGFGYTDVRMFFIPLFGAAVSGKARNVAAWKAGVVSLLGPIPGIVVAFVLTKQSRLDTADGTIPWRSLTISLVSINAFNLLPLAGLDGAQLLQRVLFSRRRWLEVGFQLCACLATAAVAIKLESWVLGGFAYLMVLVLPHRWRLLGAARRLRDSGRALPADPRDLDDELGRVAFLEVDGFRSDQNVKTLASLMDQLIEAAHAQPPSVKASLALGFTWFIGLVFALVTLVMVYSPPPAASVGGESPPAALPSALPDPDRPDRLRLRPPGDLKLPRSQPGN